MTGAAATGAGFTLIQSIAPAAGCRQSPSGEIGRAKLKSNITNDWRRVCGVRRTCATRRSVRPNRARSAERHGRRSEPGCCSDDQLGAGLLAGSQNRDDRDECQQDDSTRHTAKMIGSCEVCRRHLHRRRRLQTGSVVQPARESAIAEAVSEGSVAPKQAYCAGGGSVLRVA